MWMARGRTEDFLREPPVELGQVTLSGAPVGVALAGERRNVTVCLPGGYHWTPDRGQTVLVVKSGPEGAPCVVGTPAEEAQGGQVRLSVVPGTEVCLGQDGIIRLTGPVQIQGNLTVQGAVAIQGSLAVNGQEVGG